MISVLRGVTLALCLTATLGHTQEEYSAALSEIDFNLVKADLTALFTDSQDFWPADYGNYGPFFVRLAWHCSGSYRTSDGRGGCEGGRQRFEPEQSWDDNTNLDKARHLLRPIKDKYGLGLSWGDLFILAGTTAIESMGGPTLGFCGGRVDDLDGSESLDLGPSPEQEEHFPCEVNGDCHSPLGSTTVGLIYLNPEGPMGVPNPEGSFPQIRDAFGRMAMNDTETVALIGGGHAFGKTHGACPDGPGLPPNVDPVNPWAGNCGTGKGDDTFTSGFEGPWTMVPTQWSNDYFVQLLGNKWEVHTGPGGHNQWRTVGGPQNIMMLTSDVSLTKDPSYLAVSNSFLKDQSLLDHHFSHAWYKLVTRDMGPVTRCKGNLVPPAQPFQYPLPPPLGPAPNYEAVSKYIEKFVLDQVSPDATPDMVDGKPSYGALMVNLAYQCASTFRQTDYMGGCNGARIRFAPENKWATNAGTAQLLDLLDSVKQKFGPGLSWADLIVTAGSVALEMAGSPAAPVCPGRTDALNGKGSTFLKPEPRFDISNPLSNLKQQMGLLGFSAKEMVALMGRPRSLTQQMRLGFSGVWANTTAISNDYFKLLKSENWVAAGASTVTGEGQFQAGQRFMTATDLALKDDAELSAVVDMYAGDEQFFLNSFTKTWVKLMNADRFDASC